MNFETFSGRKNCGQNLMGSCVMKKMDLLLLYHTRWLFLNIVWLCGRVELRSGNTQILWKEMVKLSMMSLILAGNAWDSIALCFFSAVLFEHFSSLAIILKDWRLSLAGVVVCKKGLMLLFGGSFTPLNQTVHARTWSLTLQTQV